MNRHSAIGLVLLLAAAASGQTATITTTVNGGGAATIEPGGSVTVSVRVSHTLFAVAGLAGGTVIDGNAGVASGFFSSIPALPTVNFGSFVGGSRLGADIAFTPPGGFGFVTPPSGTNPMPVWQYNITLSDPGRYDVTWITPLTAPNVRLYASIGAFSFIEVPANFVGATITVVPGVGTAGCLGFAGVLGATRGRRGRIEAEKALAPAGDPGRT